jgi:hypothetical protein
VISPELSSAARDLFIRTGLDEPRGFQPLPGGANNRVFRVGTTRGQVLLKAYFQHPSDPRDRLKSEFSFVSFAWHHGIRCVPQPIAADEQAHIALYEFLPGRHVRRGEPDRDHLVQAAEFFVALNRFKETREAGLLPDASEACFSLQEHLTCVEERMQRLARIECTDQVSREALEFVKEHLTRLWQSTRRSVRKKALDMGVDVAEDLDLSERCLSPSDFGFHNALVNESGMIRFIDFEYAGWDDPAKMVCDFFCQPKVPAPLGQFDDFVDPVASVLHDRRRFMERCALLMPVYRVKWCCILLNEFLPVAAERRRFSDGTHESESRKRAQLLKAKEFSRIAQEAIP